MDPRQRRLAGGDEALDGLDGVPGFAMNDGRDVPVDVRSFQLIHM